MDAEDCRRTTPGLRLLETGLADLYKQWDLLPERSPGRGAVARMIRQLEVEIAARGLASALTQVDGPAPPRDWTSYSLAPLTTKSAERSPQRARRGGLTVHAKRRDLRLFINGAASIDFRTGKC
jgi:hypothetical protein